MTNMTNTIYGIVRSHNGIKCIDIAHEMHSTQSCASGILSMLKRRNMVFNENKRWYAFNFIEQIIHKLDDIHESLDIPLGEWAEGYVTALVNFQIIHEDEFDELIEYIKKH